MTECGGHQLPTTFSSSHNRMILHSTKYRNLMNEPISLTIQQYQSNGSHCKISIRRDALGLRWFFVRLILFFIVAQCATIVFCYNKLPFRLFWTFPCLLTFVAILLYIFSPVKEESLMLLDNLDGLEYEKQYLFGKSSSTFINTNQIIINEGITMQRVIFYLVAIPLCLQPLVLSTSDDSNNSKNIITVNEELSSNEADKMKTISKAKLIPLFTSTKPRLDCLKVVYSYIIKCRHRTEEPGEVTSIKNGDIYDISSIENDSRSFMMQFKRHISLQ